MEKIISEPKLNFSDVLIKPQLSNVKSRKDVDLTNKNGKIGIIVANMDTTGTIAMAKAMSELNCYTALHKHHDISELSKFNKEYPELQDNVFYTFGIADKDFYNLGLLNRGVGLKNICLDIANGYIQNFQMAIKIIRKYYPESTIMAGNVCTPEGVEALAKAGADIIKCGIGGGSHCKTRNKTGIGYPQLSCIIDCYKAAKENGVEICSDGGCKEPSDVAKAFAAGASSVMIGGMVAGTDECEGEWVCEHGHKKQLKFYGMSSKEAMIKYDGVVKNYRTSEGHCSYVDYKGPVSGIINDILGGLRSACTYVGANNLNELTEKSQFIKIGR